MTAATQALELSRPARFQLVVGGALLVLADTHASRNELTQAKALAAQALDILRPSGHRSGTAWALRLLDTNA